MELRGPAVAVLTCAFVEIRVRNGETISAGEPAAIPVPADEGGIALRVVATAVLAFATAAVLFPTVVAWAAAGVAALAGVLLLFRTMRTRASQKCRRAAAPPA